MYRRSAHTNTDTPTPQPGLAGQPQPGLVGRTKNPYANTHTLDPSHEGRGYRKTQTQARAPHNSRKPSVHSPYTEAARAMQVTRPNIIWSPGVRLHPRLWLLWDWWRTERHASTSEPKYQ